MKRIANLFLSVSLLLIVAGCDKDNDPLPARSKTDILTAKSWITQETYILEGNNLTKYERGASGNTVNFDSEIVTFNTNGSGTFKDIFGATLPFTWSFTDAQQTKMRLIIQYPNNTNTLDYVMVNLSEGVFSGSLTYILNGTRVLASFKRVYQP